MQYINPEGLTPDSWRTVMQVVVRLDDSGMSDYVQFLIDRGQWERAYYAFQTRAIMTSDCDDIMLHLTQLAAWAITDAEYPDLWVWVYQWGRDCDCMESSGVHKIYATMAAFDAAVNDMYDSAEGPCEMHMVSPAFAADFEPSWRDRAAEQMGY